MASELGKAISLPPVSTAGWRSRGRKQIKEYGDKALIPVVIAGGIALWAGLVAWQEYPVFILPGPGVVWRKLGTMVADGSLLRHAQVTLVEVALGLLLGLTTAFVLGYLLGKSRAVERVVAPYIVASQSVPIVAIAPLLVIWFGSGLTSKVLVCALITFFPTLINTVVGEFAGADAGLGYLINLARGVLDTPLMFVAVLVLVVIAQALYLLVAWGESVALRWQR